MPLIRLASAILVLASVLAIGACGPSGGRDCPADPAALRNDPLNCGSCGNACDDGSACIDGRCLAGLCQPGTVDTCYTGAEDTLDVGPCVGGTRVCDRTGAWGKCEGEIVPLAETCGDAVDNNCNGMIDEDADLDGDGFTTCGSNGKPADCCDYWECSKPKEVNAAAFDAPNNMLDDDCNGKIDDTPLLCDIGLDSNSMNAREFAKAIDICRPPNEPDVSDTDYRWGVVEAKLTLTDGTGVPDKQSYSIRQKFGDNLQPQGGVSFAIISSGGATAKNEDPTKLPQYQNWVSYSTPNFAPYPADWYMLNNNTIPNAPGCPSAGGVLANDPVMLTLRVRVPTNAKSFRLSANFFSAEFPEYTCTSFNDFFVVLLDSGYNQTMNGMPPNPNPIDKNLAFFQPMGSADKYPVGVNLAYGNTGLFTQCKNGSTGCAGGVGGQINTCVSTAQLAGTGFDEPSTRCNPDSLNGGGTGWLRTAGNVVPGEIIKLRIAIWDTSDHAFDSAAIIDGFAWSTEPVTPGTVVF
ncbi:MAG TPA: choice-of-anchor L domain-containing protein [Kofleriaceae bacterium]|nr:choice-of-anchor L domain-containing protein [Kofleriaceae bacterium]